MSGDDGTRCGAEKTDSTGTPGMRTAIAVVEGIEPDGATVQDEYETEGSTSQVLAKFRDDHGWGRFESIDIVEVKQKTDGSDSETPGQNWDF